MGDAVAIANNLFMAVSAEVGPNSGATRVEPARESKVSFEDTPALARIREDARSDKKYSRRASDEGPASSGVSDASDEVVPAKGGERSDNAEAVSAPARKNAESGERRGRSVGQRPKGDEADVSTRGEALARRIAAKSVDGSGNPALPKDGDAMKQGAPGGSGKADVAQAVSGKGVIESSSVRVEARIAVPVDGEGRASSRKTQGQSGKVSDVTQPERALGLARSAKGGPNVAAAGGKGVALVDKTRRSDGPQVRANPRQVAEVGTVSVNKATVKSRVPSAEKQAGKATGETGSSERKAPEVVERPGPARARPEHRQVSSQEASPAKAAKQAQVAASGVQSKDSQPSVPRDGAGEHAEQSISGPTGSGSSSPRLSAQQTVASSPDTAAFRSTSQSVGDQILDSVRASLAGGERQVLVRLNPPELGSVTVRFQSQGEEIKAVLEVSRNETRYEVERAIPELLRTLQEGGVQIRRVDVVMSDQSGKDPGKEQLQQDTWAQQQGSHQHTSDSRSPFAAERMPYRGGVLGSLEQASPDLQSQLAEDRIDMLV